MAPYLTAAFLSGLVLRASAVQPATSSGKLAPLNNGTFDAWEQGDSTAFSEDWRIHHTSPWKPVEQGPANGRNLCIDGKQVPDFYVLGVQKCATSSLAMDLMDAGMRNVHGDLNPKEFHWFDHRMDYTLIGHDGFLETRRTWLQWMPTCPKEEPQMLLARLRGGGHEQKRVALADFTPDYLRIVPRPNDLKPTGMGWLDVNEENRSMPVQMRALYGPVYSEKLRFAVMIRNPLEQMQSAWYHAQSFNFENACRSCEAPSFQAALASLVEGLSASPPKYTAWLWTVLYARQLENWFAVFFPSQFHIIPSGEYTRGNKDRVCLDIQEKLSFKMDCQSHGEPATHAWSHEHAAVEADAPAELIEKFHNFMGNEANKLINLLASQHANGLKLAGYDADTSSYENIEKWLIDRW